MSAALALAACKPAPVAADFGEAVALDMEGSAAVPAFRVVFRARPPADPHALVSAVAGLAHDAIKSCPAFATQLSKLPVPFGVNFAAGRVRAQSLAGESGGRACFAAAMDGRATEGAAELLLQVLKAPMRDAGTAH